METAIAIQIFVAIFCAFMALRKERSPLLWALIGLVPVVGVIAVIVVSPARAADKAAARPKDRPHPPARPKRCCGRYIPDCRGCPYFRRALFQSDKQKDEGRVGHCEFFDRNLYDDQSNEGPEILFEE
jgi:hypothetical protein